MYLRQLIRTEWLEEDNDRMDTHTNIGSFLNFQSLKMSENINYSILPSQVEFVEGRISRDLRK